MLPATSQYSHQLHASSSNPSKNINLASQNVISKLNFDTLANDVKQVSITGNVDFSHSWSKNLEFPIEN